VVHDKEESEMKVNLGMKRGLLISALILAVPAATAYGMTQRGAGPAQIDAYGLFKDGPVRLDLGNTGTTAKKTIATLSVPTGRYAIFAKGYVEAHPSDAASLVSCRLQAGGDFDRAKVGVDGRDNLQTEQQSFALNVLHHFQVGGTIQLVCSINGSGVDFRFIKITALTVQSYLNTSG